MATYNRQGRLIQIGAEIGRGGEGKVCELADRQDLVAKFYHQPVAPEKARKLSLMAQLQTEPLLRLAAWPLDTLHDQPGGNVIGFLMPNIAGYKPIHSLYSPKDRLKTFPEATWPALIHAAKNITAAFAVIHKNGHVVGDVNHGNLVVAQDMRVKFIDCDSFQIVTQGQAFHCEVGVSTHTPPELQGQALRGITRSANHDAFGLAVVIFQLLFMGRHPFSGGYLGTGDMSLEQAIREFRFAYGLQATARQMRQPPATLPLSAVSAPVASLFERAFSPEGVRPQGRPSAVEWHQALGDLARQLAPCQQHNGHHFLKTLATCPWCQIESQISFFFFNFLVVGAGAANAFDLEALWAQIAAIPAPGLAPKLEDLPPLTISPSPGVLAQRSKYRWQSAGVWGAFIMLVSVLYLLAPGWIVLLGVVVGMGLAANFAGLGKEKARKEAETRLQSAQTQWREAQQRWLNESSDADFQTKLRKLEQVKIQYKDLPKTRERKLQQLKAKQRERQLYQYLDQFEIHKADIPDIGANRKATLQSYGIETAADVKECAILAIPGFGPARTRKLMDWREKMARGFTFNPALAISPQDIASIEQEIGKSRLNLERELRQGVTELQQLSKQISAKRQLLKPLVIKARKNEAQAKADKEVF